MEYDDERVRTVTHALGRVVFEMSVRGEAVDKDSIVEMLEFYRRITTDPKVKSVYRDAAELVRTGKLRT